MRFSSPNSFVTFSFPFFVFGSVILCRLLLYNLFNLFYKTFVSPPSNSSSSCSAISFATIFLIFSRFSRLSRSLRLVFYQQPLLLQLLQDVLKMLYYQLWRMLCHMYFCYFTPSSAFSGYLFSRLLYLCIFLLHLTKLASFCRFRIIL